MIAKHYIVVLLTAEDASTAPYKMVELTKP